MGAAVLEDMYAFAKEREIMAKTTADLLVERLIEWDIDTIFGLPGDGVNSIVEALARGERDRHDIIKTVIADKVREVI